MYIYTYTCIFMWRRPLSAGMCCVYKYMCKHIYMHIFMYMYILYMYILYMYILCIYIYIGQAPPLSRHVFY